MIFSEDNWGRFEAMVFVVSWVAVGAAAMILLGGLAHLAGQGMLAPLNVIRPVVAAGALAWLSPWALSNFREVGQILRLDHSAVPKPLMITVTTLSLASGMSAIIVYQTYLLGFIGRLHLPWAVITVPLLSAAVLVFLVMAYAAAVAWLVIFPPSRSQLSG